MNRYDFDLMAVATAALEEAENEVERALKEVRALSSGPEGEKEISEMVLFMKHWDGKRTRKHVLLSDCKKIPHTVQKSNDDIKAPGCSTKKDE